jgi:hypothetical protein
MRRVAVAPGHDRQHITEGRMGLDAFTTHERRLRPMMAVGFKSLLKSLGFVGYGLQPVHKCPNFKGEALAPEGLFARETDFFSTFSKCRRRMTMLKTFLILFMAVAHSSWADDGAIRAKLLNEGFYKKQDVCADARKSNPSKPFALILLSTHLCDAGTHVCLDSLRTITDDANIFVKKNFVVYQTRFYSFDLNPGGEINRLYYSGEKEIRQEWGKQDMNPEMAVMDLKTCRVQRTGLIMSNPVALRGNFIDRYLAYRKLIMGTPGVEKMLGPRSGDAETVKQEVREIGNLRAAGKEEQTRSEAYNALIRESQRAGLRVVGTNLFIAGFTHVGDFLNAVRNEYGDPSLEVFITTSGRLRP